MPTVVTIPDIFVDHPADTLTGDELIEISQGGQSRGATLADVAALAADIVTPPDPLSITAGSTTTLAAGASATVAVVPDGPTQYHLDFGIPAGPAGSSGASELFADAISATTVPTTVLSLQTVGKATAGDGGEAIYELKADGTDPDPTGPTTAGSLKTTANGRKARLRERVLTPAHFGYVKGMADARQVLRDLATELRWRGGGRVEFPDNHAIDILSTTTGIAAGSTYIIFQMNGVRGSKVNFNGSRLRVQSDIGYSPGAQIYLQMFELTDARDIAINDFVWDEVHSQTYNPAMPGADQELYGTQGFLIAGNAKDIYLRGVDGKGGCFGLVCYRVGSAALGSYHYADRARGIILENSSFQNVEYGAHFLYNGDHVEIKGCKFKNAARWYTPHNVSNHKVEAEDAWGNRTIDSIMLNIHAQNANTYYENTISNIDVSVTHTGLEDAKSTSTHAVVTVAQLNASQNAPALLDNIKVKFNCQTITWKPAMIARITKPYPTGGYDNVARGHVLNDIIFSGTYEALDNTTAIGGLFSPSEGDFSVESVNNVGFRDFHTPYSSGSQLNIDGAAFTTGLLLENTTLPNQINWLRSPTFGALQCRGFRSSSLNSSGFSGGVYWTFLPDGRIRQSGQATVGPGGGGGVSVTVSLPVTMAGVITAVLSPAGSDADTAHWISPATNSVQIGRTGGSTNRVFYWEVIGYY